MTSQEGLIASLFRLRRVAKDTEKSARDPDTATLSLEAKLAIGAVMALFVTTTVGSNSGF